MTGHVYTIRILLCHAAELQHEPKKQPSTVHGPKQSQGVNHVQTKSTSARIHRRYLRHWPCMAGAALLTAALRGRFYLLSPPTSPYM